MSFILDALKKSESERLRQDTPGFADVPGSTQEKPASRWIWIIVALIGINITVLVVIFMSPDRVQDPVAATTAEDASFSEIVAEAKHTQPAAAAVISNPIPAADIVDVSPQNATPAPVAAPSAAARITESHATFNDLRAQGILQLPDMHLDIHVYSSKPENRFVFVNMSKYKERATLDEGPVIQEITPDGVVLEHLGTKFLLPRE